VAQTSPMRTGVDDGSTGSALGYRPELDGLRAFAVGVVVAYHAGVPGFSGGHVGVAWFFVLSGFLITTLLLEERDRAGFIGIRRFYQRRALRLLPTLYLVLAVFFVLSLAFVTIDHREFISAGLYFSNMHPLVFGTDAEQPFFLHTWSLSLEEQFYLIWPLVIARLTMGRTALALAIGLIGVAFVSRLFIDTDPSALNLPVFSLDGFAVGAILAVAVRRRRAPRWCFSLGVTLATCLVMTFDVIVSQSAVQGLIPMRMLVSQVAVAIVILHLVSEPESRLSTLLRMQPLVYVGLLSYALYLWHFPIFELFTAERMGDQLPVLRHGAKYLLTAVCAIATYHLLEQPISKRRARLRAPESK